MFLSTLGLSRKVAAGVLLVGAAFVTALAAGAAISVPRFGSPATVARVPWDGYLDEIGVADVTGDGKPDIVGVKFFDGSANETHPVVVLAGDGIGGFKDVTKEVFVGAVPRTQHARHLVFADFNRDGRMDFFIADHGNDNEPFGGWPNTLVLSAPNGKLVDASANLPEEHGFTHAAAAGDVNGDGAPDLYVGNICCGAPPEILVNDGSGHFSQLTGALPASMVDYRSSGELYTGSALADVNGDGSPDLVFAGEQVTPDAVMLNDGRGHFRPLAGAMPAKPFSSDAEGLAVEPVELNGDGRPDVLLAFTKQHPFYEGRWIQVLINNGDGTFRDETSTRLPQKDNLDAWPYAIRVADLNGDDTPDLAVAVNNGGTPPFYLNKSGGSFTPLAVSTAPPMFDLADVNGDGRIDIVSDEPSSRGGSDTYSVSLQQGASSLILPSPTLTPGRLNPAVKQSTIKTTICKVSWIATVRPPASYTNALKVQQMAQYHETGPPSTYEEDHFIPLELGGAPRDPKNLWPEPRSQSTRSDPLEMALKRKVCRGLVTLATARRRIATFKRAKG
jgi:VCBS repeat protein